MQKLYKKIIYKGLLECITGLHIGDNKESTDIGGVDLPVVRRKDNGQPYIPGSSMKGKMRCLLELVAGENADGRCANNGKDICRLFGATENRDEIKKLEQKMRKNEISKPEMEVTVERKYNNQPSRLLVRDAFMQEQSANFFKKATSTDMPYTEVKFENTINRIKGTAEHPRQQERVPAGAVFVVEFVINVFAHLDSEVTEMQRKYEDTLKFGIALLNHDYLGGSGSRGYGQVKITLTNREENSYDKP